MRVASQPYSQPEAVRLILDETLKRVRQNIAAPVLLGITGIDCSGKSTLAAALLKGALDAGIRSELVHVDDFIISASDRKHGGRAHIDYFENTFDFEKFVARVRSVATISGVQLVIGEGVFLFRRELVGMWHAKVWLEMSPEQSAARGAVRDAAFFGSRDAARSEYLNRFMPAHEYHVERDTPAKSADLVFEVQFQD